MPLFCLLSDPKIFYPTGQHVAPIHVKFVVGSSQFHVYRHRNVGCPKAIKITTNHLHDFYKILSICASLYVAFSFLFGDFS